MILQCRTANYRTSVGVLLAAACIAVAVAPRSAEAATAGDTLLQPTPLILKDGRIAEVSVHVVPFQPSGAEIARAAAGELAGLTRSVATDCFLTAQVIGHVGPAEVPANDSLAAHRLARARADAVQASLIGGGLPAKSIASVWDWQFMVPEPRATLWLFRLTEGEDCDGTPLPGSSGLVAETEAGAPAPQPASTPKARAAAPARSEASPALADRASPPSPQPGVAASRPQPEQAAARPVVAQPQHVAGRAAATVPSVAERDAEGTAHIRQAEAEDAAEGVAAAIQPEPTAVPAGPALAEAAPPRETREIPAVSPPSTPATSSAQKPPAERTRVARATPTTTPTPRATPPAAAHESQAPGSQAKSTARAAVAAKNGLVITFATNSSYFPPGTSRQLRSLVRDMAAGERYRVVLQVGVSGSDKVVGAATPEEARRYNRWLAERRVERVQTWLSENAAGADLVIEPQYLPGNEERTVVVRIAPAA